MGNQQASVFIRSDKPGYTAGEDVSGTVYISVNQPFQCKGVFLKLKAEEKAWMHRRLRKTRTIGEGEDQRVEEYFEDVDYRNQSIIFQADQCVMSVAGDGMLPVGQYEIPFAFQLPAHLPGNFYEERFSWGGMPQDGDYFAEIVYSLDCLIDVAGFMSRDIKSTSYIQVSPSDPGNFEPALGEITRGVYMCCCFPQGEIYMRTYPNEAVYKPGDRIKLNLEVDNRSKQLIKKIDVKLQRHITLHLRGPYNRISSMRNGHNPFSDEYGEHRPFGHYSLSGYTHRQTITMCESHFEGLEPGQSALEDQARALFLDLYANGHDFECETKGRVIECSYTIAVVCDSESMFASDIQLNIPTHVIPDTSRAPVAQCYAMTQPQVPSGWNPTVQPQISLTVNV